jgi:predicted DNA-binding transcriptional regulator AlpA
MVRTAANDNEKPIKLLRYCDLSEIHGIRYSRRHLRRLEDTGVFPKRVHTGPKSPAWFESEVQGYLAGIGDNRGKVQFNIAA